MIVGQGRTPVLGGYRWDQPEPICLVRGVGNTQELCNKLTAKRDDTAYAYPISQPWHDPDTDLEYDACMN